MPYQLMIENHSRNHQQDLHLSIFRLCSLLALVLCGRQVCKHATQVANTRGLNMSSFQTLDNPQRQIKVIQFYTCSYSENLSTCHRLSQHDPYCPLISNFWKRPVSQISRL